MVDDLKWRPVRVHADDEDAFDAQMLLNNVAEMLQRGRGASWSFIETRVAREPSVSLLLSLDGGRRKDSIVAPLYEGWPFRPSTTRRIMRSREPSVDAEIEAVVDIDEILCAVERAADLCAAYLPLWDNEQERAALEERLDTARNFCALLHVSSDPRVEAYRNADGGIDVDRSDDYDGAVMMLMLDPEMAGDDRGVDDILDAGPISKILVRDPFDLALTSMGSGSNRWRFGRTGPDNGIVASSSDLDPMDILRRVADLSKG